MLQNILKWSIYKNIKSFNIQKHLLLVNTLSCGSFMLLGEIFVQRIKKSKESKDNKYNYERIKQSTVVGLSQGPLHHYIYLWIERSLPGTSKKIIFKKILVDQFLVSPIFISHFLYTSYFLEGRKLKEIHDLFKQKFPKIYAADWMVWPLAQIINFSYVPLKYRVLYVNVISLFYSTFLCYIKHNPQEK